MITSSVYVKHPRVKAIFGCKKLPVKIGPQIGGSSEI